jgi:hypothetical protein
MIMARAMEVLANFIWISVISVTARNVHSPPSLSFMISRAAFLNAPTHVPLFLGFLFLFFLDGLG